MSPKNHNTGYILLIFVFAAGCARDYEYQYMSLIKSMDVLEYGPPEAMNIREHSDMPISYVRESNNYVLFAAIDTRANNPTVIFSGVDLAGNSIRIDATGVYCFLFDFEIRQEEIDYLDYPANGVRLKWDDRASPECEGVNVPTEEERRITITVFDDADRTIGKEEIYFDIVTNGIRSEVDSI